MGLPPPASSRAFLAVYAEHLAGLNYSSNKVWLAVVAAIISGNATGAFQDFEQTLGREARLSSTYRYGNARWPVCLHWFGSVRMHQYDRMYDRRQTRSMVVGR
jgi:hypothetical protein